MRTPSEPVQKKSQPFGSTSARLGSCVTSQRFTLRRFRSLRETSQHVATKNWVVMVQKPTAEHQGTVSRMTLYNTLKSYVTYTKIWVPSPADAALVAPEVAKRAAHGEPGALLVLVEDAGLHGPGVVEFLRASARG